MSRTKLMKPGYTRSVNCRGGCRRAKNNSGKNVKLPEKGVKHKLRSRYVVSPRVDPAQLNPEKMPHIELVDLKNYGNWYILISGVRIYTALLNVIYIYFSICLASYIPKCNVMK